MKRVSYLFSIVCVLFSLTSCFKQYSVLDSHSSQLELRQIQSRRFDTADKVKVMRAVIATLQDLGFIINKADEKLGTISAVKRSGYTFKMTVTVHTYGETQTVVRANGQLNLRQVSDSESYQQFFTALSKSLFLQAHNVD